MTRLGLVTLIAVGGLAVLAAPADAAQKQRTHYASAGAYDGLWSVSIHTAYGPCDPTYRYPARIVGGRVLQADNDFSYQISGAGVARGAIGGAAYVARQNANRDG